MVMLNMRHLSNIKLKSINILLSVNRSLRTSSKIENTVYFLVRDNLLYGE